MNLTTQARRAEPAWLTAKREEARAAAAPAPDRTSHRWKYTDPALFAGSGPAGAPRFDRGAAVAADLAAAPADLLGALVPASSGRLEAENLADFAGGAYLRVPAGVRLDAPVDLRACLPEGAGLVTGRILLDVGAGAEATVLAGLTGGAEGAVANVVVEAFVGPGATLRLATVLDPAPGVRSYFVQRARADRDARVTQTIASLSGHATKVDTGTVLAGEGAEAGIYGFAAGGGRRHFDHRTVHDHAAGRTSSDIDFKVVLAGRARSAYTGLIRIAPGAAGAEAYQENRNLLLSRGARADSIPELEILTDDVRCTHGSATGPVDEEQIFYLLSRGLSREEAVRLVVTGFLAPALSRLPEDLAAGLLGMALGRLA